MQSVVIKIYDKSNMTFQKPKAVFQDVFIDVIHDENANAEETFEFLMPFDIANGQISEDDFVEWDGHKFIVSSIITTRDGQGRYIHVTCEGLYRLLLEKIITPDAAGDTELLGATVTEAIQRAIRNTPFNLVHSDDFGTWDIELHDKNTLEALNEIRNNWVGVDVYQRYDFTPPQPATGLTLVVNDRDVNIKWTDPDDTDWFGTKLVRNPTRIPLNSTDGIVVVEAVFRNQYKTTGYVDTNLPIGTYYYKAFPYDRATNINSNSTSGSISIVDIHAPGNVTSLTATPDYTNVAFNWVDPTDSDWVGTKVVRKANSAPANELDGTLIKTSIIRNQYQTADFIDNGPLTAGTIYYYAFYPYDQVGNINRNPANIVSASLFVDSSAPGNVINLAITSDLTTVTINWTDPTDVDWAGTKIIRKAGSAPINAADGIELTNSTTRDQYATTGYADVTAQTSVMYYYGVFPYDSSANYNINAANIVNRMLVPDTTPPGNIISPDVVGDKVKISLRWTDPTDTDWAGTKVVRKQGSAPTSVTDGTLLVHMTTKNVYQINPFIDSSTIIDQTYYYGIFPYDLKGNVNLNAANIFSAMKFTDVTAPGNVTGINVTSDVFNVYLKWTDPIDSDWTGTRIVRKQGSAPTAANDGIIIYTSGVRNAYQTTAYVDPQGNQGLDWGNTYYYGIFPFDDVNNFNTDPSQISSIALVIDETPPANVILSPTNDYDNIYVKWTDPDDRDLKGVKVLRREDQFPVDENDPLAVLVVNSTIRDQYKTNGFSDTVERFKTYYYQLFPYDLKGNVNRDLGNQFSMALSIDTTPPGNVTNFTLASDETSITIKWTDATDADWRGVYLLKKIGSAPVDHLDGQLLASPTAKNQYSANGYVDSNVQKTTTYYYALFSYDRFDNWNQNVANIKNIQLAPVAPGAATITNATFTNYGVHFKWTDPVDSDWSGTKIIRKEGSFPVNEGDGTLVLDSKTRNQYSNTIYTDGYSFNSGTTYYYGFFPYDNKLNPTPNYNYTAKTSITWVYDGTATGVPSAYSANNDGVKTYITWTDPTDSDWSGTKLVRKASTPPTSPTDGTLLVNLKTKNQYQTTAYQDTSVTSGIDYYYGIFPYDTSDNYNLSVVVHQAAVDNTPTANLPAFNLFNGTESISTTKADAKVIRVVWTDPADTDWKQTIVRYKVGSYPTSITDGTQLVSSTTKNQYLSGTPYSWTNPIAGSIYYFKAFTYDTLNNLNSSAATKIKASTDVIDWTLGATDLARISNPDGWTIATGHYTSTALKCVKMALNKDTSISLGVDAPVGGQVVVYLSANNQINENVYVYLNEVQVAYYPVNGIGSSYAAVTVNLTPGITNTIRVRHNCTRFLNDYNGTGLTIEKISILRST